MWDYEYDYKVPKREIPRFVPPINIEFVESEEVELEKEIACVQLDGYTWVVGSCDVTVDECVEKVKMEEGKDVGKVCA